jgi:hypothetical protein
VSQRALLLCGDRTLSWRDFINAFLFWTVILKEVMRTNEFSAPLLLLKRIVEGTSARTVLWQHARLNGSQHEQEQQRMNAAYGLQESLRKAGTLTLRIRGTRYTLGWVLLTRKMSPFNLTMRQLQHRCMPG